MASAERRCVAHARSERSDLWYYRDTDRGIEYLCADAYALLRKTAMNQNRKISEIAESLITAAGLLAPPEDK